MDKIFDLTIDEHLSGRRIEYILEKHMDFSSTLIKSLKKTEGSVLLNGESVRLITKVHIGDKLFVNVSDIPCKNVVPANIPLNILYEDAEIMAVNKPRLMPVHPSKKHVTDTLANGILYYLGENSPLHIITRLDRDTSGVVLIAKNKVAAAFLTDEMKKRNIQKEYIAVVCGLPVPAKGEISAPIGRKSDAGIARCVSKDGKEAISQYEVLYGTDDFSVVKLIPVTGRTHQLRVHMSYIGNPIYGDAMYGAGQESNVTLLHCRCVTFAHPVTKEKITVTAQIPDDIGLFM